MMKFERGQIVTEHNDSDERIISSYMVVNGESEWNPDFDCPQYAPTMMVVFYCIQDEECGISATPGDIIRYPFSLFAEWKRDGNLTTWKIDGKEILP